jgi:uncharacterized protein (DUF983 family)
MAAPGWFRNAARILRRGLRLRCPRCGGSPLFPHGAWFTMASECALCGLRFERAQGYFVGAIYVNYAATVLIVMTGYWLTWRYTALSTAHQLLLWIPVVLVFPVWFFRLSRSLWLALEYAVNPGPDTNGQDRA